MSRVEASPSASTVRHCQRGERRRKIKSITIDGVRVDVDVGGNDFALKVVDGLASAKSVFSSTDELLASNLYDTVDWVVFDQDDEQVLLSLFLMYRQFLPKEKLLMVLKVIYAVRAAQAKSLQDLQLVQGWVGRALVAWLSLTSHWKNLTRPFFEDLCTFMDTCHTPAMDVNRVNLLYVRWRSQRDAVAKLGEQVQGLKQTAMLGDKVMQMLQASNTTIGTISATAMAHNLTLLAWADYMLLTPTELYRSAWQKSFKLKKAPHLCALADYFNRCSYWVAGSVITHALEGGIQAAVGILCKFIDMAEILFSLNNFNTLAACLAGLNMHSVARIKALWNEVPAAKASRLAELNRFVSPQQNYKRYRSLISKVKGAAAFPYVAVYLRDLAFIEDGNASHIDYAKAKAANDAGVSESGRYDDASDESCKLLNVEKVRLLGDTMHRLLKYQNVAYDLSISPQVVSFILVVSSMDEDTLYEKSIQIQPVGSDLATGLPTSDSEYPLDSKLPTLWQPDDVAVWLKRLHMADFQPNFRAVNGVSLLSMQSAELERLGVTKLGDRMRLMKAITELNEWEDPEEEELMRAVRSESDCSISSLKDDSSSLSATDSPKTSSDDMFVTRKRGSHSTMEVGSPNAGGTKPRRALSSSLKSSSNIRALMTGAGISFSFADKYAFLSQKPETWNTSQCKRWLRLCPDLKPALGKKLHRHSMAKLIKADESVLEGWGLTKEEDRKAFLWHQSQLKSSNVAGLPFVRKPLKDWDKDESLLFIASLGLLEYEAVLVQKGICGEFLAKLENDTMVVMGIKVEDRRTLSAALKKLRDDCNQGEPGQ